MTTDVSSIDQSLPLESAVSLMQKRRVKRLPVMDGDKLVGIITRADFIRALGSFVTEAYEAPTSDAEIRTRILSEAEHQSWAPKGTLDIRVRDGNVQLRGTIMDERQRGALKVLVENVPGVRDVRDYLICLDPIGATVLQSAEEAARVREEVRRA